MQSFHGILHGILKFGVPKNWLCSDMLNDVLVCQANWLGFLVEMLMKFSTPTTINGLQQMGSQK